MIDLTAAEIQAAEETRFEVDSGGKVTGLWMGGYLFRLENGA